MALTASEKRRGAEWFARKLFAERGGVANLSIDSIEAAFDAAVTWWNGNETNGGTPRKTTLNAALPQPFKADATVEQKSVLVAAAALFIGGVI